MFYFKNKMHKLFVFSREWKIHYFVSKNRNNNLYKKERNIRIIQPALHKNIIENIF